jgi:1,4-alpha-glucan branching enzyme
MSNRRTTGRLAEAATSDAILGSQDLHLFNEGTHCRLYRKLGAHVGHRDDGTPGVFFTVWAPNARRVSVIGDWNDWSPEADPLTSVEQSGLWHGFVERAAVGSVYKYRITARDGGYTVDKADPFAFRTELPPATGSVVASLDFVWDDADWMTTRGERASLAAPMSIYEVHLGSWRRGGDGRVLSYREIAPLLADHVERLGFTHVELLPVMEHPFYGSWGYQCTAYFAPTSRQGAPQDLMVLIDTLHRRGIGVILDWVPSHFPSDEHGLAYFDGTHLYEHADRRQGFHPDWGSSIFNYGRNEVRSFLLSSAFFWLDRYHADGLRVDAVASMLYLDYSRKEGEWIPNRFGGRENLDAIAFLRQLNESVYGAFPDVQTIAEESTSWPMVSRPLYLGGLGFGLKWDMGWMHDTLAYMKEDPVHRKWHHRKLSFRMLYAWHENFVLPLSHDEVVHLKGSLLAKMPGDAWRQFANLRLLLAYQFTQPGKKLLFMGGEFGQGREWNHDQSLDWHQLDLPQHAGVLRFVEDLGRLYREDPTLHERDCDPSGFEWVDADDTEHSVVSFLRRGSSRDDWMLVVANFTPVPRGNYRVGVPEEGFWTEILNGDSIEYGGSGQGNLGGVESSPLPCHGRPFSLVVTLPPLAAVFFRWRRGGEAAATPGGA